MGRPLTAVEIDACLARGLRQRLPSSVHVVTQDFLTYQLPTTPHVLVGNLPFHQTTAMLRRFLHAPAWTDAILLVQWEVARRRAGVGGATMMTAQWAPWFEFALHDRVPARAFIPRPSVDGGLLTLRRREEPLLAPERRRQFQALVHRVYPGSRHGLAPVLTRSAVVGSTKAAEAWLARHGIRGSQLPKDLPATAWVDLFTSAGSPPPASRGQSRSRGRIR